MEDDGEEDANSTSKRVQQSKDDEGDKLSGALGPRDPHLTERANGVDGDEDGTP